MQCTGCGYALWNITTRQCPECGKGFVPSDFDFVPGAVRFHCPHCEKAYYGMGERGHLVPRAFSCVECGRAIDMDEMALTPAVGVEEEQTSAVKHPWLERRRLGGFRAYFTTVWWAMIRPPLLGRVVTEGGSIWSAWVFMLITQVIGLVMWLLPVLVLPLIATLGAGRGAGGFLVFGMGIAFAVALAATSLVLVPLWGLTAHLLLRWTGRTTGGYGLTFRAICYSSGANFMFAVPCFGHMIGPVWWLVSAPMVLKEAQRVNGWRASLAALVPPLALVSMLIAFYAAMAVMIPAATMAGPPAPRFATTAPSAPAAGASAMARALVAGAQHDPMGRSLHPLELVGKGAIEPSALMLPGSKTTVEAVYTGGHALAWIPYMAKPELDRLVEKTRLRMTEENVTEFRLGDCVFLTEGVDLGNADPGLWVVVMCPDPTLNGATSAETTIWVATADGNTQGFPARELASGRLRRQNDLRAEAGLAPIRDPREVTE